MQALCLRNEKSVITLEDVYPGSFYTKTLNTLQQMSIEHDIHKERTE
jgi:hypothetical protein